MTVRAALVAALVTLLAGAAPAMAQERLPGSVAGGLSTGLPGTPIGPNELRAVTDLGLVPAGRTLTGTRVGAIADRLAKVRRERREYPGATREVYLKGVDRWQVSYFARVPPGEPRKEIAQVLIDDRGARVLEAWTDYQVPWSMARGYPGAFGRVVNAPWVWVPLALLFAVPFLRRPWGMLQLDVLALSAFSLSLASFNAARVDLSVPLVTPLLAYLLARMLQVGLRRRGGRVAGPPLRLLVPVRWLAIAVVFLIGFRVALNVSESNVIDVGYAGVIGADRIVDGRSLYGAFPSDNASGDTYGPVVYLAYVPFEQALAWSGRWDDLPAAHGAAIAFDLLACLLCFLVGRRVRGPDLGVLLAYCWVTFPFTLYALMSNANDALVAALVLAAVWVAAARPAAAGRLPADGAPRARPLLARGALVALAGLTKLAPLALAPLFAFDERPWRMRGVVWFGVGFAVAAMAALSTLLVTADGPRDLWDATIAFQAGRGSPFSIWGLYDPSAPWLDGVQKGLQVAAAGLALALAFVPRRRDVVGLAACAAAILIALQLTVEHWFYLYIPWFFPLVMLALLGRAAAIDGTGGSPRARTRRALRRARPSAA